MILKYFISAVGEFQNKELEFDFGFHTFGPFRKLTRHRAATPGANVFVPVVIYIVLVVLLVLGKNRCAPLTSPLTNATLLEIGQDP